MALLAEQLRDTLFRDKCTSHSPELKALLIAVHTMEQEHANLKASATEALEQYKAERIRYNELVDNTTQLGRIALAMLRQILEIGRQQGLGAFAVRLAMPKAVLLDDGHLLNIDFDLHPDMINLSIQQTPSAPKVPS